MSGASFEEAKINYRFKVPKNLESRRFKQADSYVDVEIRVLLPLASSNIELEFNVDNQAKDHRLRVLIPQNTSAKNSVADIQFGKITRAVYDKAVDVWQEENWDERPDTIYPFLNYVHTDTQAGLAVLSNSVREYQIIDGQAASDTIAITLFRSYGYQGRKDLLRRPGRASGTNTPTPDAQLVGKNTYKLGLTSEIKDVAGLANAYTTPFVYYAFDPAEDLLLNKSNVEVPEKYSLFNFEISGIILSALKKAESGKGLVVRMFNSSSAPQKLNISGVRKITSELMLDETEKCKIKGDSQIEFKPFEIKTFMMN
ncbi:MAG: glycoside hydrolase family 38 C-terminal domain-containing protein [Coriobacteriia bacterium]|nr:glycoside hydrolase family 38 C-terminal domain-containing protein [Coriobacteriia bacterium]